MNFLKKIYDFLFVPSSRYRSIKYLKENRWEEFETEDGYFSYKKGLFEIYCGEEFVGFHLKHVDCSDVVVKRKCVLDEKELKDFFNCLKQEMNKVGENYRKHAERLCFCALDIEV